jgi:hypothetical protein
MDTVIVREVGYRPVLRGEWSPTGMTSRVRVYRLDKAQWANALEELEKALQYDDPAVAERAAADLVLAGSKAVRPGLLREMLGPAAVQKSLVAEDGQAVRPVADVRGDFGAYMEEDLRKSRGELAARQAAVERLRHHDLHCAGGPSCEIEGTGRWARA